MKIEIKRLDLEVEGDKRQYVPFKTIWECPDCGFENELDHSDDYYFSYPIFGKPTSFSIFCRKCDQEGRHSDCGNVKLCLDVVLTIIPSNEK